MAVAQNTPAIDPVTPSCKRPARMPGLVGTNAAFLVQDHIQKKFADGWHVHVPLTFLTDKGCLMKDRPATSLSHDVLTIDSATGQISTSSKSLSDDGELDLSFDEWHQAWRRLLDLIKTYIPDKFAMWEVHYHFILDSDNRAKLWPLYLAYDAEIQKRTVYLPIDPSKFSIGIWNDLEARYTAKKVLSLVQSDLKNNSHTPSSQPDSLNGSRNYGTRNTSNTSSFRGHQITPDSSKSGRCIFCGDCSRSHTSRGCLATCNMNGTPCHMFKTETGARQTRSGKRYCYSWNLTRCDQATPCRRGDHCCTLCGSSSHTAQLCEATA